MKRGRSSYRVHPTGFIVPFFRDIRLKGRINMLLYNTNIIAWCSYFQHHVTLPVVFNHHNKHNTCSITFHTSSLTSLISEFDQLERCLISRLLIYHSLRLSPPVRMLSGLCPMRKTCGTVSLNERITVKRKIGFERLPWSLLWRTVMLYYALWVWLGESVGMLIIF